jgi:hypothetical protein
MQIPQQRAASAPGGGRAAGSAASASDPVVDNPVERGSVDRLDPERRRRRLQLLAEYADATTHRTRISPERDRMERIRELVSARKRLAS